MNENMRNLFSQREVLEVGGEEWVLKAVSPLIHLGALNTNDLSQFPFSKGVSYVRRSQMKKKWAWNLIFRISMITKYVKGVELGQKFKDLLGFVRFYSFDLKSPFRIRDDTISDKFSI